MPSVSAVFVVSDRVAGWVAVSALALWLGAAQPEQHAMVNHAQCCKRKGNGESEATIEMVESLVDEGKEEAGRAGT
jgi:hypothetical protein